MKAAVIGVGNMGSKYAGLLLNKEIKGLELAALTRVKDKSLYKDIPIYETADKLFEAVEDGSLKLDAVIIATPHVFHEEEAVRAFKNNLHVICDKPSGVKLGQALNMNKTADLSKKVFSMVFNQRTNPLYQRMKEIVESKIYGELKRVNWIVTDWYRPEKYFSSSSWHASWKKDGGGVLLNQCPHNLDLLQWICGMPVRLQAFCKEGHFHNIEVEDDATLYFEWKNGATGTFITSTGDAPGINRLEISLDEAMLICENGELTIRELFPEIKMKEIEYRKTSEDFFKKLKGVPKKEEFNQPEDAYKLVLQNFSDAINNNMALIADGREGYKSLLLSNAAYLSSWKKKMLELPEDSSKAEEFAKEFEEAFNAKLT